MFMDERPDIKDSEIYFVVACLSLATTIALTFILEAGFRSAATTGTGPITGLPAWILALAFGLTVVASIVLAFDREPSERRANPTDLFTRLPRELPWLATLRNVCAAMVVVALAVAVLNRALS